MPIKKRNLCRCSVLLIVTMMFSNKNINKAPNTGENNCLIVPPERFLQNAWTICICNKYEK